jgi:hypothetical protein
MPGWRVGDAAPAVHPGPQCRAGSRRGLFANAPAGRPDGFRLLGPRMFDGLRCSNGLAPDRPGRLFRRSPRLRRTAHRAGRGLAGDGRGAGLRCRAGGARRPPGPRPHRVRRQPARPLGHRAHDLPRRRAPARRGAEDQPGRERPARGRPQAPGPRLRRAGAGRRPPGRVPREPSAGCSAAGRSSTAPTSAPSCSSPAPRRSASSA